MTVDKTARKVVTAPIMIMGISSVSLGWTKLDVMPSGGAAAGTVQASTLPGLGVASMLTTVT